MGTRQRTQKLEAWYGARKRPELDGLKSHSRVPGVTVHSFHNGTALLIYDSARLSAEAATEVAGTRTAVVALPDNQREADLSQPCQ